MTTVGPTDRMSAAITSRGDSHRAQHRYEDAIADYNIMIDRDRDDVDAIAGRGLTYWTMGKYDNAAADFRRVVEIEPELYPEFERYLTPPSAPDVDQRD